MKTYQKKKINSTELAFIYKSYGESGNSYSNPLSYDNPLVNAANRTSLPW